jgi:hypothetical protein
VLRLRTLLIVIALGPLVLAGVASLVVWAVAWLLYLWIISHHQGIRGFVD